MELHENITVYHYDVEIEKCCQPPVSAVGAGAGAGAGPSGESRPPPRLSKGCKNRVFSEFCKEYNDITAVFDGEKNMYTTKALPILDEAVKMVFLERSRGREGSDEFSISVRKVAELSRIDNKAMVQALDIAIRHACSDNRAAVGRLLFNAAVGQQPPLPAGIVVGEGLFTSLRVAESGVFINVDVVRAAFFDETRDLAFHASTLLSGKSQRFYKLHESQVQRVNGVFSRMTICVKHLKYPRKSIVQHVTTETAKSIQFEYEGKKVSVAEYFETRYPPRLSYPSLPCIYVGGDSYYPMEKCFPTKFGTCVNVLKEFFLSNDTKPYMRMAPDIKFARAKAAAEEVAGKSLLRSFFKDISVSPVQISARQLQPFRPPAGPKLSLTIDHWIIANMSGIRLEEKAIENFSSTLIDQARDQNVFFNSTNLLVRDIGRVHPHEMIKNIKQDHPRTQIVFVVLEKNSPYYSAIKYYAETRLGLITQCVAKATFVKPYLASIASNLMRKVKAKMGGGSESVMPACVDSFTLADAMIIGADVSHHGPHEKGKPSVAAIVGSIDSGASRYVATFRVQAQDPTAKKRVEIIEDMEGAVRDLLRAYKEENKGAEPRKIVYYRDGVSEGQFSQVLQSELSALRVACRQLQVKPSITLVTVQKRHRTRFLAEEQSSEGAGAVGRDERHYVGRGAVQKSTRGSGHQQYMGRGRPPQGDRSPREDRNVKSGTIVDTVITHPCDFDFYLCSHNSPLGTARPAHYYVLCDENGFTSDTLQKLTFGLCHVYARCQSPVSIPAPVYYAHHGAARAACYLQARAHDCSVNQKFHPTTFELPEQIKRKMFFI